MWLNQYFGPIQAEGKEFDQMAVYERHRERIEALVKLPKLNPYTSGKDLELMIARKLTFEEALAGTQFGLMEKQRLKAAQKAIFGQLSLMA